MAEVRTALVSTPRREDQAEVRSTQIPRCWELVRQGKGTMAVMVSRDLVALAVVEEVVVEQARRAEEVLALMSAELVVLAPHQLSRDQV